MLRKYTSIDGSSPSMLIVEHNIQDANSCNRACRVMYSAGLVMTESVKEYVNTCGMILLLLPRDLEVASLIQRAEVQVQTLETLLTELVLHYNIHYAFAICHKV